MTSSNVSTPDINVAHYQKYQLGANKPALILIEIITASLPLVLYMYTGHRETIETCIITVHATAD